MQLEEIVKTVQTIAIEKYTNLMSDIDNQNINKEQVLAYILKIIKDKELKSKEYEDDDELAERIYKEFTGYSILDEMFLNKEIEEINILSWRDIIINYNNGTQKRSGEYFFSANHEKDIVKRLLSKNGMNLNKSNPIETGYLQYSGYLQNYKTNIRITAIGEGVAEDELGFVCSIRIINPKKMTKEDFINGGLCNDEMLNFLTFAFKYGVSMCITGETGSGKTTLMSYIMEQIPDEKRLITLEENTREYNLHKYDKDGFMVNNVVHLITKLNNEKESENITLKKLVQKTLTLDPNYICVSEMKGDESYQAVVCANTGHTVITTTHSSSCEDTYFRILTLSKQSMTNDISTGTLMTMISRGFPIIVNIRVFPDKIRRINEITECEGWDSNGNLKIKTLYKYKVAYNEREDDKIVVYGNFEKPNHPTEKMKELFINGGATDDIIKRYFRTA